MDNKSHSRRLQQRTDVTLCTVNEKVLTSTGDIKNTKAPFTPHLHSQETPNPSLLSRAIGYDLLEILQVRNVHAVLQEHSIDL
ncbi:hypothetical protein BHOIPH791_08010 [Bartonella henselae]|uniref:hypothetical protein n=2 Tax=Bartonella TaxID=773 RepID=UPI0003DF99D2|nr:hypothetical protein [Bartonella henselae]ETS07288.1 hypothetical protein Q654_01382 [Bartonella henselae JK 50]ETS07468.1 hypothetical protein Q655_01333 [Bartonella henselae JK 51]MDM9991061.1 hypothetical protein [Bartonella henselae]OLL47483.1 hypothetical protein AT242_05745 [Bartonella henselae]OLL54215.1 hypothetical protein AT238_05820 [Bartonella henselae]